MEDIDAAFHHGLTRDFDNDDTQSEHSDEPPKPERHDAPVTSQSRITLSGLLNALDGVGAQEGRILFATTNRYFALDPALCRPGRMDIHVEFKLASKFQAEELYKCFYLPSESDTKDIATNATEKAKSENDGGSSLVSAKDPSASDEANPSSEAKETTALPPSQPASAIFSGNSHRVRAPNLSQDQVLSLARRFADAIPEREFSMASLQGYLMTHKSRPHEAVKEAESWVSRERSEKPKTSFHERSETSSTTLEVPEVVEVEVDKGSLEGGRSRRRRGGRGRGRGRSRRASH